MDRPAAWLPLLAILSLFAFGSLAWAGTHALGDSADLLRRAKEIQLLLRGSDPYQAPDMTYPPTALPVFAPLVAPFGPESLKVAWLVMNLVALALFCGAVVRLWGRDWPAWLQVAFCLAVVASKPVRGGIGLGQFHLIPMVLMLLSVAALNGRRSAIAGLLVGLALAKPTMAVPFLGYLAVRREWRALAVAALSQVGALMAVSCWLRVTPWRLMGEWLANARRQEAAGMIDVPSLVARAWPHLPVSSTQLAAVLLIVTFAAMLAFRRQSDFALVSFSTFMAAIFTYHRPYDLVLLVPALALAVDTARHGRGRSRMPKALVAILFAVLLISPSHPSVMGRFEHTYEVLFIVLSYAFLAWTVSLLATTSDGRPRGNAPWEGMALGRLER